MTTPLISVMMPAYNAERYIGLAIESILSQTCREFEFLIVDDGSTDRTGEIVAGYAAKDSRIRLIQRPNTGYLVALNEMLAMARGTFVARMDADDIALPDRFQKQVQFFNDQPDHLAIGSRIMMIDPDGCDLAESGHGISHEQIDAGHIDAKCTGALMCHPSVMMRTDALRRIGGYRQQAYLSEDLDLFLRFAEIGKVANLPDILLKYRMHESKISQTRRSEQLRAVWWSINEARTRRGMPLMDVPSEPVAHPIGADLRCVWAWWALNSGHVKTARKHAFAALRLRPWDSYIWRTALCAARGR